jgi:hypothetical protein
MGNVSTRCVLGARQRRTRPSRIHHTDYILFIDYVDHISIFCGERDGKIFYHLDEILRLQQRQNSSTSTGRTVLINMSSSMLSTSPNNLRGGR